MELFEKQCSELFISLGDHKKMVLSTSLHDKVSSRMMSLIILEDQFYFQTDHQFRKYEQIQKNPNVSLCIDNVQVEGICEELGHTLDNPAFCELFRQHFPGSYELYTRLANERLFRITPVYMQKWIYENKKPFVEMFDFVNRRYQKEAYKEVAK